MLIAITNEKGGSGKTNIAINLAVKLSLMGDETLLIDADPQRSVDVFTDIRADSSLPLLFNSVSKIGSSLLKEIQSLKQKYDSVVIDIKKNIEYRNIPRWVKISEQSIYKKVLQLESKEYIVSHKEKEGNMPDKAIYTITNKGNDYFNKLMNDISNSDVSLYLDFNVIITNLDLVDDEQKQILVSNIKSKILELKELLNERRSHRQHIPNVGKQMFKQQLALVETLEKWIIDFENSLKEQN